MNDYQDANFDDSDEISVSGSPVRWKEKKVGEMKSEAKSMIFEEIK